jgi:hypothetical protein
MGRNDLFEKIKAKKGEKKWKETKKDVLLTVNSEIS